MDKFAALADPTRRSILEMLAKHGQLSVAAIAAGFSVSPPAISQHLKVLHEAGLVKMEKRAQQHLYRLNPEAMSEFEDWARQLQQTYDQRFEALDRVLNLEMKKEHSHEKKHSDR